MLRNYIKIALRNLYRYKVYSFINIFGLAVGIASALVIGLWVYEEWSYDRHFEDAEDIYRVSVNFMNVGDMAVGPIQLNEFMSDFPEVEKTGRLTGVSSYTVRIDNNEFEQSNIFFADSTFFEVLEYNFAEGSAKTAMDQPGQAVLTLRTARKFFGSQPALGQTFLMGPDNEEFTVVGVVDTEGTPSHIIAEMWVDFPYRDNTNWLSASVYNYVKLNDNATPADLEDRLFNLIESQVYPSLPLNVSFKEWIQTDGSYKFIVMPLTDIYTKSELRFEMNTGTSQSQLLTFFGIALLIILIASVNFINITTARSSIRAKEVGIRKTLGTRRSALIIQFLLESVFICFLAFILSLVFAELFLAGFEQLTGLELLESIIQNSVTEVLLVGGFVLTLGLLAGIYPALYLTRFKPVKVLKGQIHSSTGSQSLFRNSLVFIQFSIAICLLIGTAVIYKQLNFMRTTDLGLDRENVLIIQNAGELENQTEAFKQELLNQASVQNVSLSRRIPASNSVFVSAFKSRDMQEGMPLQSFLGDYEMVPVLGFNILEGRNFSRDVASDTNAVLLNQSAVQAMGLSDPIGEILSDKYIVIGVVADFNYETLRKKVEPTVIEFAENGSQMAIKFEGNQVQLLTSTVNDLWNEFGMEQAINYYFLDENYERLTSTEEILSKAVLLFAILAIIISCLGLYGLSSFITDMRTKEIGIRRVLGASVSHILLLLNKSFAKPILAATIIAVPVSIILMNEWLSSFAFKADIGVWIITGACITALFTALSTVSWQSLKAANSNPVDSLRNE